MDSHQMPEDLVQYLKDLITPYHVGGKTLFSPDVAHLDWTSYQDEEFHAAILGGDLRPCMEEVWRVLKPGAHLLLVAPEDEPMGYTGACAIEDRGFEIRDAILWVYLPRCTKYVAKAAGKERHAGCEHLVFDERPDVAEPDEDEKEDWAARADKSGKLTKNIHPTVKPLDLMRKLVADVPPGATVVDPWMGSGSTAIACLERGVNFIGVEMEKDYLTIADARVRHWHRKLAKETELILESEAERPDEGKKKAEDIFSI